MNGTVPMPKIIVPTAKLIAISYTVLIPPVQLRPSVVPLFVKTHVGPKIGHDIFVFWRCATSAVLNGLDHRLRLVRLGDECLAKGGSYCSVLSYEDGTTIVPKKALVFDYAEAMPRDLDAVPEQLSDTAGVEQFIRSGRSPSAQLPRRGNELGLTVQAKWFRFGPCHGVL